MTDRTKTQDDNLRDSWVKSSRATLSATFAFFLLSRGEKIGSNKILEAFGLDWSSLDPYAVGLFGVPVVVFLIFWSLWWARTFAKREASQWYERVVTKSDTKELSHKARTLALWSLLIYVGLPIIGLLALEGKFLHGTFSFAITGDYSCPMNCESEPDIADHFWPSHGLPNIWNTPYRYAGNLTYLPPWQAYVWVGLGLAILIYAISYLHLVWRGPLPARRHSPAR